MKSKEIEIRIQSDEELMSEAIQVMEAVKSGERVKATHILAFDSLDHLRKILTKQRLRLLCLIKKERPKSIYALAKLARRDYGNVHRDIKLLKNLGLVETKKGLVSAVDALHINVPLKQKALA